MRMWMIPPSFLCRKHLLGEHLEIHMTVGSMLKGKSLKGYLDKRLLFPGDIHFRHTALVVEMLKRGYNHLTPIPFVNGIQANNRDMVESISELTRRCPDCRKRIRLFGNLDRNSIS